MPGYVFTKKKQGSNEGSVLFSLYVEPISIGGGNFPLVGEMTKADVKGKANRKH